MLAAGTSKSKTIGWVGGMPAPNMLANLHAYEAGAAAEVPDAKVLHSFIGSWFDPPKTKEAAVRAGRAGGRRAVGSGRRRHRRRHYQECLRHRRHDRPEPPRGENGPDVGPVGHRPAGDRAVGKEVDAKTWTSKNWSYGIAEGSVKLADFHGLDANVPAAVLKAVTDKFEAIKSGAFTVPLDTSNAD